MKKRMLSLNEMNWAVSVVMSVFLLLSFVKVEFYFLSLASVLLWVIKYYYLRFKSRKLPGKSIYRSRMLIEIHMGNKAKGDFDVFLSMVAQSVLFAHDKGLDCVFYAYHLSPRAIKKYLGNVGEIKKTTGFERFAQLVGNRFYKDYLSTRSNKPVNQLSRVYIKWNNISPQDITQLKALAQLEPIVEKGTKKDAS
ncbi:hypothetical protein [Paenibacillus sp. FSL E2-0178]|uniref:hypothetical protein n=1 Tax=Paenibacillus sp. FSL E2-0178 TaxID=2921361 RepID=UPI00315925FA